MAVQIPRIQRADPSAPQPTGQMNLNIPNMAEANAPVMKASTKAVQDITELSLRIETEQKKQQAKVWDTKSTDISNQFEMALKDRLHQIKQKDGGDTTKDFTDYDSYAKETYDQIMSDNKDMDPSFNKVLQEKMSTTYGRLSSNRNQLQYEQWYKYENNVTDGSVKIAQDNAFEKSYNLSMNNPQSFLEYESYLSRIEQYRISQGDKNGTLVRGANGEPLHMEGSVGVKIRSDIGDVVINTVTALNAAGKVDEAKKLINDYGAKGKKYLNAADESKLISDNNESDVRNQALVRLSEMKDSKLNTEQDPNWLPTLAQINSTSNSEAVKHQMRGIVDTQSRHLENEKSRRVDAIISAEFNRLQEVQNSNEPYLTVSSYMESKQYKNAVKQGVEPKDLKSLTAVIEAPIKSTNSAISAFNQGIESKDIYKWKPSKFNQVWSGLNELDRARLMEQRSMQLHDSRQKEKAPEDLSATSLSDVRQMFMRKFKDQMQNYTLNGEKVFQINPNDKNSFSNDYDNQALNTYVNFMEEDVRLLNKKPTANEYTEIVNKRFEEMLQKRKVDTESRFLGSWRGPGDFTAPQYRSFTPSGSRPIQINQNKTVPNSLRVTPPTTSTSPSPEQPQPKAPTVSSKAKLPNDSDNKAWLDLYRQLNGNAGRPKASDLRLFKKQMREQNGQ